MPARVQDGLLAAVLSGGQLTEAVIEFHAGRWNVPAAALMTASGVVLFWRRRHPLAGCAVAAVMLAAPVVAGPSVETFTSGVVITVAAYSLAAYGRGLRQWAPGLTAVFAASCLRGAFDWGFDAFTVISGVAWCAAAFGAGLVLRRQRELADQARRYRDEHAAAVVAAERARIARDLHDVVAHSISVIVLQARGGRRMLTVDPAEARAAFDTVEEAAGEAMSEMRRLLTVLRAPGRTEPGELTARPSLAHLGDLVDRLGGLRVTTTVCGDVSDLPPGVDLAAYRIVQEALTNVLRHASARSVALTVAVSGDAIDLEVADDGVGDQPGPGGFGLLGMRERAAMYGGTVEAGPGRGGGFRVVARLPRAKVPA
jgi:signal transduction histidine kinase